MGRGGNVLNRPDPEDLEVVDEEQQNYIHVSDKCIIIHLIKKSLKNMKNGKAAGTDKNTTETLKADKKILHTFCINICFARSWVSEITPKDLSCGLIVNVPKMAILIVCGNWHGIKMLSVPSKVVGRVLVPRLQDTGRQGVRGRNKHASDAGKAQQSTSSYFAMSLEQSLDWNTSLHTCFVDYEEAFYGFHCETL